MVRTGFLEKRCLGSSEGRACGYIGKGYSGYRNGRCLSGCAAGAASERECKTVGVRVCECVLGEQLTVRGQKGWRGNAECAEEDRS